MNKRLSPIALMETSQLATEDKFKIIR